MMRKIFFLALAGGACSAAVPAWAQAPSMMPDGSYDMYAGLGVRSAPKYEGGMERQLRALPVLQVAWGNGVFVSGMSAGWHLSSTPGVEFGPLLSLHAARSKDGGALLDSVTVTGTGSNQGIVVVPPNTTAEGAGQNFHLSYRVRDIGARPEGGFFFNVELASQLRLTNNVLYGAGQARNGLRWTVDMQRGAIALAPHHTLALTAGATLGNRAYNTAYFGLRSEDVMDIKVVVIGIDDKPAAATPEWAYAPSAGIKDIHAGARWNWALSPAWMLTTNVQWTQLRGGAKASPLTERAGGVLLSTALAYRF